MEIKKMINITVEGPTHAGKGYVIAAITKALKDIGCDVSVQGEKTHNAEKLAKTQEEIVTRLNGQKVRIMEMQTSL